MSISSADEESVPKRVRAGSRTRSVKTDEDPWAYNLRSGDSAVVNSTSESEGSNISERVNAKKKKKVNASGGSGSAVASKTRSGSRSRNTTYGETISFTP